jgi:hypothetical protein
MALPASAGKYCHNVDNLQNLVKFFGKAAQSGNMLRRAIPGSSKYMMRKSEGWP